MLFGPFRLDDGLLQERMQKPPSGSALWDRIFVGLIGLFTLAELLVPGFDRRWEWTKPTDAWELGTGLFMVAAGTAGIMWAMRVNRFFSTVIRIQKDRGHHVIDFGPYQFLRHPGYAFWMVRTLGAPLLLGSHWAFLVAIPFIIMLIIRTALEDHLLQRELPGYAEYATRTRWRLFPAIW
jgi:protein-S-isoprenylcysteine O-methyltransferase Ste14